MAICKNREERIRPKGAKLSENQGKKEKHSKKKMIEEKDDKIDIENIQYLEHKVVVGIDYELLENVLLPRVVSYFEEKAGKLKHTASKIKSLKL